MEKKVEATAFSIGIIQGLRSSRLPCLSLPGTSKQMPGLWLAGNEGMEKKVETAIMGYRDCYTDPFLHSQLAKGKNELQTPLFHGI